jgi:nicotinate-nucleotide adenylyltransferase
MRTGIFGGSFDPIHTAHLILAETVRVERSLDSVLFVPAGRPPHKPNQPVASAEDRLCMVELAIEGNPFFRAARLELERQGPSFTLLTVRELRKAMPEAELFLILGGDSLRDLPAWWHSEELVQEVAIISFDRPGAPVEDVLKALEGRFGSQWVRSTSELRVRAPLLEISASGIRRRLKEGKSVRYLVPEPVWRYIIERGPYAR